MFGFVFDGRQTRKESLITILCILGSVSLVVVAFVAYQNFQTVVGKDQKLYYTNMAIFFTEKAIAELAGAETSQRGYIITGDSTYLSTYTSSKDSTYRYLDYLRWFSQDDPEQQSSIDQLAVQIDKRIQLLNEGVMLKKNQQEAALQAFFAESHSKNMMDQTRQLAQAIIDKAIKLRAMHMQMREAAVENTRSVIYAMIGGSLLLYAMIFFLLTRATRQRLSYEEKLSTANKDLHAFAEEMQATNEDLKSANRHASIANEKLVKTTGLLQETQNIANLGHWEVDLLSPQHNVNWSDEIYRIHGLKGRKDLTLAEVQDYIFEEDLPTLRQLIERLAQTGESFNYTFRIHRADGETRHIYTRSFAVRDEQGNIIKRRGILQDITEQKIINDELVHTTAMLKESQAHAHLGHWEIDLSNPEENIFWSDELYRIYGIDPSQKITRSLIKSRIHKEDEPELRKLVQQASAYGHPYKYVYRIHSSEGMRFLETRGFPILDEEGKVIKVRGVTQDITARKKMEKKLQEANEVLEQRVVQRTAELQHLADTLQEKNEELMRTNTDLDNFIYMSSHDLKHPITNLEGLLSIIPYINDSSEEEAEQWMEMMTTSVFRLKSTIAHITEISKIQKGLEETEDMLDFEQITEEVKQDIAQLIEENQATIYTDFQIRSIVYIPKYLKSIIHNLLSNAIIYRHPERTAQVHVVTYREKQTIVLAVQDNGLGLSESDQKKLFKMFKRLHVHVDGTGIGLYMIKRMVENHGGSITVESKPQEGTTFRVYFNTKKFSTLERHKVL